MTSTRLPAQESAEPDDSLSVLLGNPERVEALPLQSVPALLAAVAAKQAALTALQGLLVSRLLAGGPTPPAPHAEVRERLLTAAEVAQALGVTPRWVQRRARRLPFARRLSDHAIRYSETGLKRWLANRHVHVA